VLLVVMASVFPQREAAAAAADRAAVAQAHHVLLTWAVPEVIIVPGPEEAPALHQVFPRAAQPVRTAVEEEEAWAAAVRQPAAPEATGKSGIPRTVPAAGEREEVAVLSPVLAAPADRMAEAEAEEAR
jgi:hypothetical protein